MFSSLSHHHWLKISHKNVSFFQNANDKIRDQSRFPDDIVRPERTAGVGNVVSRQLVVGDDVVVTPVVVVDDDVVIPPVVVDEVIVSTSFNVVIVVVIDFCCKETYLLRQIKKKTLFLLKRSRLPISLTLRCCRCML